MATVHALWPRGFADTQVKGRLEKFVLRVQPEYCQLESVGCQTDQKTEDPYELVPIKFKNDLRL